MPNLKNAIVDSRLRLSVDARLALAQRVATQSCRHVPSATKPARAHVLPTLVALGQALDFASASSVHLIAASLPTNLAGNTIRHGDTTGRRRPWRSVRGVQHAPHRHGVVVSMITCWSR